jgi:hypothetical protein
MTSRQISGGKDAASAHLCVHHFGLDGRLRGTVNQDLHCLGLSAIFAVCKTLRPDFAKHCRSLAQALD